MAVLSTARATARVWLRCLQLLRGSVLAALLALHSDAARLHRGAVSANGAMVVGLASKASVPSALDGAAARAQRDRDLRTATDYLDSINVEDYLHLGNIKDTLERFENIRERVLSFGAARDARHRLQIRSILRDIRKHSEALKALAGKFEAEGQVDDGGDEPPTQRDNICSHISQYHVGLTFVELVHIFCESLDDVRRAVDANEDEEQLAYSVSGLWITMSKMQQPRQNGIGWEIERVLGEERRWVAKQLAPWPAGTGNDLPLPEGTRRRFRRWELSAWETQIWADIEVDTAALPFKALKRANDVLANATAEGDLILSSVRTRMQRIEFCKTDLAQFISGSDSSFREQVREVLHEMKVRMEALRELEARKLAAGEVDNRGDLLPSQRDNICTKLDGSGLEEGFREDVRKICENFDRLHIIGEVEFEKDQCFYELLGRMVAIRRKPGYSDAPFACELENLFAEEWSWLAQQEEVVGA